MSKYDKLQIQKGATDRSRGPGRPRGGKSSDPNFVSTTILLHKDQKKRLQMRALDEGLDLSDVVGTLLEAWLEGKVEI